MADPDLSLIVMINAETGATYVSLQAIGELTIAIEAVKHNLAEIEDCLKKIERERCRIAALGAKPPTAALSATEIEPQRCQHAHP